VVFVGVRVCVFECSVCVVRALAVVNGEVNGHSGQCRHIPVLGGMR
jgi:hypothetical protein